MLFYIVRMKVAQTVIFLICYLTSSFLFAGEIPISWQYIADTSKNRTAEALINTPDEVWRQTGSELIGAGFLRHQLWIRGEFTAPADGSYLLELANPPLDRITLYLLRNDSPPEVFQAGSAISRPAWQPVYQHQSFPFRTESGEKITLLMEVGGNTALLVHPRLFEAGQFADQIRQDRIGSGILLGIFLAIGLHCLMMWLGTGDRDFLNSSLFVFSLGLMQCNLAGLLNEYALGQWPTLMAVSRPLLPALAFLAYIRFSVQFLNLPRFCPRAHQAMHLCNWLIIMQVPLFLLWGNSVCMPSIMALGGFLILLGLVSGFVAWSRGFRPARFYLFANTLLFASGMVYILTSFNLLPISGWTFTAFNIGTVGEAILIAFSLSDKINTLQKDRNRAQNARLVAEKKVIETLRESEALLEARVRERTEQLEVSLSMQNEQAQALQQSNHKLQSLNEDMNAYMSVAAHDLKNPTSAIIGFIDLITERWESWDTQKKVDKLDTIRELATHIHAIVAKLLDVNAIESGRHIQSEQPVAVSGLIRRLERDYATQLEHKHLHLDIQCDNDQAVVWMDQDAMLEVLDNLLSNAVKYSQTGRKISVAISQETDWTQICISDQGPGISAQDQERLFRKFTRLSARPTAGEHSTGLGLYIAKRLVNACGGTIHCESQLGVGTCFIVRLPSRPAGA
jgi:signal transduction histidine kinase